MTLFKTIITITIMAITMMIIIIMIMIIMIIIMIIITTTIILISATIFQNISDKLEKEWHILFSKCWRCYYRPKCLPIGKKRCYKITTDHK